VVRAAAVCVLLAGIIAGAPRAAEWRWTAQTSGTTARLRGISASSDRVAWASGARGTILRTADGGEHWTSRGIAGAGALDFRDIDAGDERTAYVLSIGAGALSRIYKTSDAGEHWSLQFTNDQPTAFFDAMAFWDRLHGIAVSDSVDGQFVMITTADGGAHWTRVPAAALPPALPNEGAFAASGTNVAVLPGGRAWFGTGASTTARVLRTRDFGRTWSIATTPLAAGTTTGIYSIAFSDPMHGIVVGGDFQKESEAAHNAAITTDGGQTWKEVNGLSGYRSAVAVNLARRASQYLAVGPSGCDRSMDGGHTWQALACPGFDALAVSPSRRTMWAVGDGGRLSLARSQ
jgi:photosystem II stability/assembly factor-like uncharacterized protein